VDVLGDMAAQGELQRQQTLQEGGLHTRAALNTAASERMSGANAAQTGTYQAGASLLSGAASSYSQYSALKRAKA